MDKTMRDAADFFDAHTRNKQQIQKQDRFLARKDALLASRASKLAARGAASGTDSNKTRVPVVQNGNVNAASRILSSADQQKLQQTLIEISQSIQGNRDQTSVDLHRRVMKALKANDTSSQTMSEVKVLINEFRETNKQAGIKEPDSLKNWKLSDSFIWGSMADELQDQNQQNKNNKRKEKSEGLNVGVKDMLESGFSSFLGPGGALIQLGVQIKREYAADAKTLYGRVKRLVGLEKESVVEQSADDTHQNRKWRIRFSNLSQNLGRLVSTATNKLKSGASWTWKQAKGLGRFLGRNKLAVAAAALAVGGGLAAYNHFSNNKDESNVEQLDPAVHAKSEAENTNTSQKKKDKGWSISDITKILTPATSKVAALFSGLGDWIGSKFSEFGTGMNKRSSELGSFFDASMLTARGLKDNAEQARDQFWDGISGMFSSAWQKLKKFLPAPVTNALSKGKSLIVSAANAVSKTLGMGEEAVQMPSYTAPVDPTKAITFGSGVDMNGLNPAMRDNLYAMAADYFKQTGKKVKINSAKRSHEDQAALYNANPGLAAKPGYSMHEYGFAIDITDADGTASKLANMGLLQKYGFMRPIAAQEPWHVEPIAIQGAKAAIRSGRVQVEKLGKTGNGDSTVESEGNNPKAKATQTVTPISNSDTRSATLTATKQPAASTVAPSTSAYKRVASVSDVIDIDPIAPQTKAVPSVTKNLLGTKTSVSSVPLYLGDMSMLMLNLGMTGG